MLRALAMPFVLPEKNSLAQSASLGFMATMGSDEERAAKRMQAAARGHSQRKASSGNLSLAAPAPAAADNAPAAADVQPSPHHVQPSPAAADVQQQQLDW